MRKALVILITLLHATTCWCMEVRLEKVNKPNCQHWEIKDLDGNLIETVVTDDLASNEPTTDDALASARAIYKESNP